MYRPLLAILIALAGVEARADLITNGSFESTTPAVGAGTYVLSLRIDRVTGWTVVEPPGQHWCYQHNVYPIRHCFQRRTDQTRWISRLTNRDTEGLQQTIATTIGDSYTLSFFIGNVDSPSTGFGVTSTVDVFANGTSLGAFTNNCTICTTAWYGSSSPIRLQQPALSPTLTFLNGDPTKRTTPTA